MLVFLSTSITAPAVVFHPPPANSEEAYDVDSSGPPTLQSQDLAAAAKSPSGGAATAEEMCSGEVEEMCLPLLL
ncbi:unnamed protein product [Linum trigynum]|uniref:Uncharacterized protein n=1 Tax=Linum trigynum TaxID=586398 RepID=A0AAV2GPT9_9ROSI